MHTTSLPTSLSLRDAGLALAIVFIWGTNFVVIRFGLDAMPPLLMAAIRFALVLLPAALFLKKPAASWASLAAYGLSLGVGQFGLLYIAMNGFISPGMASVVVQMQVFFTIAIAMTRQKEKPTRTHLLGLLPAIAGLALILWHHGEGATGLGLGLVLAAGLCWAISNQVAREAAQAAAARGTRLNPLAYIVWSSLFAMGGLLLLSLVAEGPGAIAAALARSQPRIWGILIWQSAANTLFGYTLWTWLLSRYAAACVVPMSLLVPVFGIGAAVLVLGEPLQDWKIAATLLVMAGVAINIVWGGTKAPPVTPRVTSPVTGGS